MREPMAMGLRDPTAPVTTPAMLPFAVGVPSTIDNDDDATDDDEDEEISVAPPPALPHHQGQPSQAGIWPFARDAAMAGDKNEK
jgi:hypothetical protein